ncbi:unnamed product [Ostreococcus tauri]|uniref:Unnamed product n=1 Tax=Ostreococcus tauri TaxID=70448 RepID=Q00TI7_OSTTA|nr:unnamed product [Ostreococcus tauri]OUS45362.1 hypothetical protein BE221DRAFT_193043 [Ostreococcus tauri]CAL57829.1 unnamed product [Ostreococcus tauri]|eukprot:XP_003083862.1 unnamed product [Ostreococcus tauri]
MSMIESAWTTARDDGVGRKLLGTTPRLNFAPENQVYVFMFGLSIVLFSVPPLLKLKRALYPPEAEPESWAFERELEDLR